MSSRHGSGVGVLVVVLAAAVAAVLTPSAWVERFYSRQVYLVSQNVLTPLSSLVSFALFDLFVMAVLVGLAGWWFAALRAGRGRRWRAAGRMTFSTLAVLAAIYLIFLLAWGLNYRREPLTKKLDYDHERITAEALVDLTIEYSTSRAQAPSGETAGASDRNRVAACVGRSRPSRRSR